MPPIQDRTRSRGEAEMDKMTESKVKALYRGGVSTSHRSLVDRFRDVAHALPILSKVFE